jgi:hypothetical protein
MSAPPERRLARGTRRRPTEEQVADGSAPPAPPTETQVAGRAGPTAPPAGAAAERAPASPSPSGAPTAGSDSALRSALSVLTTLGPPLTIATALMFYFGWARSDEQARFMGLDVSLFGFSTQDYVLQSINTLYLPLLATAALALGWLALHQRVDRALTQPAARPALRSAGRIAMGAGLLAAATAVLVAALDRHRAPLVVPLVLAAGTAVTAYGGWLAGAAGDPRPPGPAGQPWPRATAFSATPLGIEAPGVREERLRVGPGAGNDDVRYRTTGLRFLVRSGGRLFLVHDGWTPRRGTVIVLPDNDQVRWQFSR